MIHSLLLLGYWLSMVAMLISAFNPNAKPYITFMFLILMTVCGLATRCTAG